jgi:hypothetical protein
LRRVITVSPGEFRTTYNINEGEEVPAFPYHEDYKVKSRFGSVLIKLGHYPRFDFWETIDESHALALDEYPIAGLLKIVQDGHIRAGWSFRKDRPTIYGPRAACCFTEMPLYGFLEYAASRNEESVDRYAIGLLKSEFFAAGGRPVIYGLSGPHRELPSTPLTDPPHYRWPRKLHPDCGIADAEQYRYVAMSLGPTRAYPPRSLYWRSPESWPDQYCIPLIRSREWN